MISRSFRVALSAFLFVGALGLASTGPVQAQSIMKQCGDEWKAAKENNTTNGMKWPDFLKQCRVQKEGAAAPSRSSCRRSCSSAGPRSDRAGSNLSAEAETHASGSTDGRGRIRLGGASQGALPERYGGLGQHQGQVPHLPLLGLPLVRHDEAGRLYVRGRRWGRRLSRVEEQDGTAEADVVARTAGRAEVARPPFCSRRVGSLHSEGPGEVACAAGRSGGRLRVPRWDGRLFFVERDQRAPIRVLRAVGQLGETAQVVVV